MGALALLLLSATPVLVPRWQDAVPPPFPNVSWIVTSPDLPNVAYASAWDEAFARNGLFGSDDGGLHWTLLAEPLAGYRIDSVQVDPGTPSRLFATTLHEHSTPDPDPDADTRVYVSEDSGRSWRERADFGGACGGSFAFAGASSEAVYLGLGCSNVVWSSLDHGFTWVERTSPSTESFGLVASPGGSLYAFSYEEIFRTRDGANSWELVSGAPPDCPTITSLMPDEDENVLIVGTGRGRYGGIDCGGISRSEDAGRTWSPTWGYKYMTGFVRDPGTPSRIFASAVRVAGFFAPPGDVLQSDDDGRTWRSLAFPSYWGVSRIAVSADGRRLYAPVYVLSIRKPLTVPR